MRRYILEFLISLVVLSCSSIENEAVKASRSLCDCYKNNVGNYGIEASKRKCDSILKSQYYLFNAYHYYNAGSTFREIPPKLKDSISKFMTIFYHEVNNNCPGYFYK